MNSKILLLILGTIFTAVMVTDDLRDSSIFD
jgi:hypothetical protein